MIFEAQDCSLLQPAAQRRGGPSGSGDSRLRPVTAPMSSRSARSVIKTSPSCTAFRTEKAWCTQGRYVGTIASSRGQSPLLVHPRFGIAALRNWLFHATNVALVESPGLLHEDESFIVQLLAAVWARKFVEAARHGLPALRDELRFTGPVVRGRLDVQNSIRLIAAGGETVASTRREKSLEHAASRAIVAAYGALRRWVGANDDQWLPQRARELLPHLVAVTGLRPQVPSRSELDRVRYTPITAGFAAVAELSRQIARPPGPCLDSAPDGECQGVLLDVAEVWELYVLAALRRAAGGLAVRHGTRELAAAGMLSAERDRWYRPRRSVRPDAVVMNRSGLVGVLDAKYKQLHPTLMSPSGPLSARTSTSSRHTSRGFGVGLPRAYGESSRTQQFDCGRPDPPPARKRGGPWRLDPRTRVIFSDSAARSRGGCGQAARRYARIFLARASPVRQRIALAGEPTRQSRSGARPQQPPDARPRRNRPLRTDYSRSDKDIMKEKRMHRFMHDTPEFQAAKAFAATQIERVRLFLERCSPEPEVLGLTVTDKRARGLRAPLLGSADMRSFPCFAG